MGNEFRAVAWWEVLLRRKDFIGGELVLGNNGGLMQAPVIDLFLKGSVCIISVEWFAERGENGVWEYHATSGYRIAADTLPAFDVGLGVVSFRTPDGPGFLYPCGSKPPLDTDEIVGMRITVN